MKVPLRLLQVFEEEPALLAADLGVLAADGVVARSGRCGRRALRGR